MSVAGFDVREGQGRSFFSSPACPDGAQGTYHIESKVVIGSEVTKLVSGFNYLWY